MSSLLVRPEMPKRIVQVAPDFYPVPPRLYGGIERMVHGLTEELAARGFDVYLYARAGSETSAKLVPYEHEGSDPQAIASFVERTMPDGVDLIHDHTHHSVIGRKKLPIPTVCSIHDSLKNPVDHPVYLSRRALAVIGRNEGRFVYNGIDVQAYPFQENKQSYLLFMGVLNWHKGIVHALDIAEKSGKRLIIAGPVFNNTYYEKEVAPRLAKNPNVSYVGEVGGEERLSLLADAECMLFPTSWEEPFGLVMVEALACGTPVLALANGAVPEVLAGFPELVCGSAEEMAAKAEAGCYPDPGTLRDYVAGQFTTALMADRYVSVYEELWSVPTSAAEAEPTAADAERQPKLEEENLEQALEACERMLRSSDIGDEMKITVCERAADLCYRNGDTARERAYALRSFRYDTPRAEFCCRLGFQHLQLQELDKAIFWYSLAVRLEKPAKPGALYYEACWTWLPYVQLCICHYRQNNYEEAYRQNELARQLVPDNEHVIHNKSLLKRLLSPAPSAASSRTEETVELTNVRGGMFRMTLELPGFLEETIIREGGWEPQLARMLSRFVQVGGIFLDVGANIGYHALYIAGLYPDATCICFEPHPDIFRQLERNKSLNGFERLFVRELAVGDSNGRVSFHMQTDDCYNRGMSAIDAYANLGPSYRVAEVELATLDSQLPEADKSRVSVMKIDTQGNELRVLAGARDIIRLSRPVVAFELHDDAKRMLPELLVFLDGYRIYKIQPWSGEVRSYDEEDPPGFLHDYICIPESRFSGLWAPKL
ncbi:FkbM family methyltransferase [Paenibacillus contaminans]|nr:FkbM family methyltransferase [Paenibacillus contaminans]